MHQQICSEELDILNFPAFAKEKFDVNCVEILLEHLIKHDDSAFHELADAARRAEVRIICLALDNDFTLLGRDQDEEIDRISSLIEKAKLLGAEFVRLNPGIKHDAPEQDLVIRIAQGIKRLLPVARRTGIRLALENHLPFGMHAENILSTLKLVNAPDCVGACLDFGNWHPAEFETGSAKLAPYAVHVHAKAYEFSEDGKTETRIDYRRRFEELRSAKYTGYISIEWEGLESLDSIRNIRRLIKLIKHCIA